MAQAVIELLLQDKRFKAAITDALKAGDKVKDKFSGGPLADLGKGFDQFKGKLGGTIGTVSALGTALAGLGTAFGAAKVISGASEADRALQGAANAMARTGEFSGAALADLDSFANRLLSIKGVSDDAAVEMFSLAKSFNLTNAEAKKVVDVAADLSAATGRDLRTSVEQLAGSFNGKIGKLAVLNPALKELTKQQLAAGRAADVLGAQLAGAAAGDLNTFAGAADQTGEKIGNFGEELGNIVVKNPAVIEILKEVGTGFERLGDFVRDNRDEIVDFVNDGLADLLKGLAATIDSVEIFYKATKLITSFRVFQDLKSDIDSSNKSLYEQRDVIQDITRGYVLMALGLAKLRQTQAEIDQKARSTIGIGVFGFGHAPDDEVERVNKLVDELQKLRKEIELSPSSNDPFATVRDGIEKTTDGAGDLADKIREIAQRISGMKGKSIEVGTRIVADPNAKPPTPTSRLPADIPQMASITPDRDPMNFSIAAGVKSLAVDFGKDFGTSLLANLGGGKEGANKFVGDVYGAISDVFVPGSGQMVSQALQLLGQDPEAFRGQIDAFIEGVPEIIDNIVENIPYLVEKLAENSGEITTALVSGMPRVAVALAESMPTVARALAAEVGEGLAYQVDRLRAGGDLFKADVALATEGFGNSLKARIPNDLANSFQLAVGEPVNDIAAKLGDAGTKLYDDIVLAGERFIDKITPGGGGGGGGKKATKKIEDITGVELGLTGGRSSGRAAAGSFIPSAPSGANDAVLLQILQLLQQPQKVSTQVMIDSRKLADVILDLQRQNQRLSA